MTLLWGQREREAKWTGDAVAGQEGCLKTTVWWLNNKMKLLCSWLLSLFTLISFSFGVSQFKIKEEDWESLSVGAEKDTDKSLTSCRLGKEWADYLRSFAEEAIKVSSVVTVMLLLLSSSWEMKRIPDSSVATQQGPTWLTRFPGNLLIRESRPEKRLLSMKHSHHVFLEAVVSPSHLLSCFPLILSAILCYRLSSSRGTIFLEEEEDPFLS